MDVIFIYTTICDIYIKRRYHISYYISNRFSYYISYIRNIRINYTNFTVMGQEERRRVFLGVVRYVITKSVSSDFLNSDTKS